MASQSGDDTPVAFSWRDPHVTFVIILVGPDEQPFAIQQDFLCAKSSYFREYFAQQGDSQLETLTKYPDTTTQAFGLAQHFMFTGEILLQQETLPGYDVLIDAWKLGNELRINGMCEKVLDAMKELRLVTNHIPAPAVLAAVWKETPEGSSIRDLFLTWTAEYIRSSESRSEFSKSLPQEVLSELVVAMSRLDSTPFIQVNPDKTPDGLTQRKNVHYLEAEESEGESREKAPKHRHSDVLPGRPGRKPGPRSSLPSNKIVKGRRASSNVAGDKQFTTEQKLEFCSDLLSRMLSGPGFWTRLVGPFREPVKPGEDLVPDYFDKVKRPMDLGTIKEKMDRKEYTDENEFCADVRQIFQNCYTYWDETAPMVATCKKFEKTFEEKYSGMSKFLSKLGSEEAA
ncbi:Bromodomain-containing protein [Pseudomassariella vexata]|uniref:Bromodomain-containing protein n=1 Tax=Pseudomassariella vexata TaxID=1141098 RepID=A0A1Y2E1D1_9PEZI|nr:Bromodomain-containing protein [Pseudomassariella vexata]ORY65348.1 Bromodomain-containing protein [Pseudomassariella vexata]